MPRILLGFFAMASRLCLPNARDPSGEFPHVAVSVVRPGASPGALVLGILAGGIFDVGSGYKPSLV